MTFDIPITGPRHLSEGFRRVQEAARLANPPAPPPHPKVAIEVLATDEAREQARRLDPMLLTPGAHIAVFFGLAEPTTIAVHGVDCLRLTPWDPEERETYWISLAVFDAITAAIGVDDDGTATSEIATARGIAEARDAMRDAPEDTGAAARRGERMVRVRMAEAVGRSWGLSCDQIAQATGRPCVPRRMLIAPCSRSRPLEVAAEKAKAEAEAKAAEARARLEAEQSINRKSLAELGLQGVRLEADDLVPPPAMLIRDVVARLGGGVCLWPALAGHDLPAGFRLGSMICLSAADYVPECPARVAESVPPMQGDLAYIVSQLRRRSPMVLDRGPVKDFTDAGAEQAAQLVAAHAGELASLHPRRSFVGPWMCEALVRGLRVEPTSAAAMIWSEVLQAWTRMHPTPMRVRGAVGVGKSDQDLAFRPAYSPHIDRKDIGTHLEPDVDAPPSPYHGPVSQRQVLDWCAAAADGGEISVGVLLPLPKSNSKKGK